MLSGKYLGDSCWSDAPLHRFESLDSVSLGNISAYESCLHPSVLFACMMLHDELEQFDWLASVCAVCYMFFIVTQNSAGPLASGAEKPTEPPAFSVDNGVHHPTSKETGPQSVSSALTEANGTAAGNGANATRKPEISAKFISKGMPCVLFGKGVHLVSSELTISFAIHWHSVYQYGL